MMCKEHLELRHSFFLLKERQNIVHITLCSLQIFVIIL